MEKKKNLKAAHSGNATKSTVSTASFINEKQQKNDINRC